MPSDDLDILVANHGIWPPRTAPVATMTDSPVAPHPGHQPRQRLRPRPRCRRPHAHPPTRSCRRGIAGCVPLDPPAATSSSSPPPPASAAKPSTPTTPPPRAPSSPSPNRLSSELAPHGIYANCVAPGWTHTEMTALRLRRPRDAARTNPTIPVGRPAHVTEIAGPILFLCTPLPALSPAKSSTSTAAPS